MSLRDRVAVLHGVNLNMLGQRDPEVYGNFTLTDLEFRIEERARALHLRPTFSQTNHEGEFVELLHDCRDTADGIILNPGAWTHYSRAIGDALELTGLPAVEVHLSDIDAREGWRRLSVIRPYVIASVSGKGPEGYDEALELLAEQLAR